MNRTSESFTTAHCELTVTLSMTEEEAKTLRRLANSLSLSEIDSDVYTPEERGLICRAIEVLGWAVPYHADSK